MTNAPVVLDLDAEREVRAAQREGTKAPLPIRIGGEVIATLPVELELTVFAPLRDINDELTLLFRQAVQIARSSEADAKTDAAEIAFDILAGNPGLPATVIEVIEQIGRRLLGEDGFTKLLAARPSREDIAALAKGILGFYGVSLGEASTSSDSSTSGGGTSSSTSSDTSISTPEESSPIPPALAS